MSRAPHIENYAAAIMASVLGPALGRAVFEDHDEFEVSASFNLEAKLFCKCGWSLWVVPYGHQEPFGEYLKAKVKQHARDVIALHSPTLADFSDWGWFHTEGA